MEKGTRSLGMPEPNAGDFAYDVFVVCENLAFEAPWSCDTAHQRENNLLRVYEKKMSPHGVGLSSFGVKAKIVSCSGQVRARAACVPLPHSAPLIEQTNSG